MTFNNLCNSCSNYGCEFQSGIVRAKCAFYMPPHIEPDNCGNYVVQPTYEARLNADTVVILNKIKAEIENTEIVGHIRDVECFNAGINVALNVIDKYMAESEDIAT